MNNKNVKEKMPQGEHCNGCKYLNIKEQSELDISGDCCKHGKIICSLHKSEIEIDKIVSNGTPFFQMPLYKKCTACLADTSKSTS